MSDASLSMSSDSTNKKVKRPDRPVYKPGMFTKRTLSTVNPISESSEKQKNSKENSNDVSRNDYIDGVNSNGNQKSFKEKSEKNSRREYNRYNFNGNSGNKRGPRHSTGNGSNTSLNYTSGGMSLDNSMQANLDNPKKGNFYNNRTHSKHSYNHPGHFQSNTLGGNRNHGTGYRRRNNSIRSIKSEIVSNSKDDGTNFDAKSVCSSIILNETASISSYTCNNKMNYYASQAPSVNSLATNRKENEISMDSLMMSLESFDWAACMEEENERQMQVTGSNNRIDEVDEEKYKNENEDTNKQDGNVKKSIFERITVLPQSSLDTTNDYLNNKQNSQKNDWSGSSTRINKSDYDKRGSNSKLSKNEFGSWSSLNRERLDKGNKNIKVRSKEDISPNKMKPNNKALKPPPSPRNVGLINKVDGYKSVTGISITQIKGKPSKTVVKGNTLTQISPRKQSVESLNLQVTPPEFDGYEREISMNIKEIKNRPKDVLQIIPSLIKNTLRLANEYKTHITRDIETTYKKQWELKMWKNGFYKVIDLFKQTDVDKNLKSDFQMMYQNFLDAAILYYKELITLYENTYGIRFKEQVPWPYSTDLTNETFLECIIVNEAPYYSLKSKIQITAITSVQRHYLSLSDLYRYKCMAHGLKSYEKAYEYCWLASQLSPTVGRSYNSLGLISLYMILQRDPLRRRLDPIFRHLFSIMVSRDIRDQERYLEMIFFYIRSLAAQFPHKGAKEAMLGTFSDVAGKVKNYNEECMNELFSKHLELNPSKAFENDKEIWRLPEIRTNSRTWSFDLSMEGSLINGVNDFEIISNLQRLSSSKLYKFAITYLVHCAGILNSKIDMESFDLYAEIGLICISALLSRNDSPLSCRQLIEITSFFIYYYYTSKNDETSYLHEQRSHSLQIIMSLFGIFLSVCSDNSSQLSSLIESKHDDLESVKKVLPVITIIYNFIKSDVFLEDLKKFGESVFKTIKTNKFKINLLQYLIDIGNLLVTLRNKNILPSYEHLENKDRKRSSTDGVIVSLPEEIFLLSFDKLFSQKIKVYEIYTHDEEKKKDKKVLGNIVRLNNILQTLEMLFVSTMDFINWDDKNERYWLVNSETDEECKTPTPEKIEENLNASNDNNMIENYRNRIIVEPHYIIPDTNCFIDFSGTIEQLIRSRYFKVTLSYTVIKELRNLSKPVHSKPEVRTKPIKKSNLEADSNHNEWVRKQAKRALKMIDEWFEKYSDYVISLTEDGLLQEELPPSSTVLPVISSINHGIVQKNDDRILQSVINLEKQFSLNESKKNASNSIKNVAMLTEDKALRIKACAEGIPCKSLSDFVMWLRM
ncbi:Telomerase-binding protein EST1A [Strongyloides ratti]|uniref:Telomerase-binding protein EST1A n=1 Tax=Strongyloides ratti TaxID=34506 RepID=A0A090L9C6_STRRB|nr:Telomerase-binding protein EST1A [Strongyloides ratti]CEF66352.1 Telomerase-binding protein EST1A [Strongyloides ratti]